MLERIKKISNRHSVPIPLALTYEVFIRLYRVSNFRSILKLVFPLRKPENIFFVLGCYNAGTTIVKNAIGLHPKIAMAPIEGDRLTGHLNSNETGGWPRCMLANCFQTLQERHYGQISAEKLISDWRPWIKTEKYYLEKSISNTCRVPLLRKAFPMTKFICVVRNPSDVIRGIQRRSKPGSTASRILGEQTYSDNLLFKQWVYFYKLILEDYNKDRNDIYFCSYEKFIDNPVLELQSILDFLRLPVVSITIVDNLLKVGSKAIYIRPRTIPCNGNEYLDNYQSIGKKIQKITRVVGV